MLESKLNGLLVRELVSRLYPKKTNKKTEHNQPRANSNNMMQTWYAMRDAICDAYARFDKE